MSTAQLACKGKRRKIIGREKNQQKNRSGAREYQSLSERSLCFRMASTSLQHDAELCIRGGARLQLVSNIKSAYGHVLLCSGCRRVELAAKLVIGPRRAVAKAESAPVDRRVVMGAAH